MSATNHTANIELPVFVGDDKPAWLTDWNGAMTTIDGAVGTAQTDISGLSATVSTQGGQISSLTTTVGNHTTSISTLTDATTHNAGDINTINSLIGNGTPTTTDQTIIGAINELHADQGDLDELQTTDKSSLVAAINEMASAPAAGYSLENSTYTLIAQKTADGVKTYNALMVEVAQDFITACQALEDDELYLVTSLVIGNVYHQALGYNVNNNSTSGVSLRSMTTKDVNTLSIARLGGASAGCWACEYNLSSNTQTVLDQTVPASGLAFAVQVLKLKK